MESQARGKTSHAVSEAVSISPQCGIHLCMTGELLDREFLADGQFQPDLAITNCGHGLSVVFNVLLTFFKV